MSMELHSLLVKKLLRKLKRKMKLFSYIFPSLIFVYYVEEATITEVWRNVSHKVTSRTLLNILSKTNLFSFRKVKAGKNVKIYVRLTEKGKELAEILIDILS